MKTGVFGVARMVIPFQTAWDLFNHLLVVVSSWSVTLPSALFEVGAHPLCGVDGGRKSGLLV